MKKVIFPSLFIMGILLVSGCQGNRGATNQSVDQDSPNSQFYTTRDNPHHIRSNDMDNLNPNFLNLNGTRNGELSGNSQNHGKDVDKAKQVINNTGEFKTASVWINNSGDRMNVTVYKKGRLTKAQQNKAIASLHRKLVHALPRYTIRVNVLQDRR